MCLPFASSSTQASNYLPAAGFVISQGRIKYIYIHIPLFPHLYIAFQPFSVLVSMVFDLYLLFILFFSPFADSFPQVIWFRLITWTTACLLLWPFVKWAFYPESFSDLLRNITVAYVCCICCTSLLLYAWLQLTTRSAALQWHVDYMLSRWWIKKKMTHKYHVPHSDTLKDSSMVYLCFSLNFSSLS